MFASTVSSLQNSVLIWYLYSTGRGTGKHYFQQKFDSPSQWHTENDIQI